MSNYVRQIEVNMANEDLKVEQPFLESSSEIDKLVYDHYQTFHRHKNYRVVGDKLSCSRILRDGEFQLTEPWSARLFFEVAQKWNTSFPRSSGKICTENLRASVKILAVLQLSLRSSGTIFTDPLGNKACRSVQILKESPTWDMIFV